jgi:hypothetical protein
MALGVAKVVPKAGHTANAVGVTFGKPPSHGCLFFLRRRRTNGSKRDTGLSVAGIWPSYPIQKSHKQSSGWSELEVLLLAAKNPRVAHQQTDVGLTGRLLWCSV